MTDEEKKVEEQKKIEEKKEADRVAREKSEEEALKRGMIPKSRFDAVNEQKKAAEAELKTVADSLLEDVPEEFKDVVPDLPPGKLIAWLRNAAKKGLFVKDPAEALDAKRVNKKEPQDLSGLTPMQQMSMGYGQKK